jgi:hypothetical protein
MHIGEYLLLAREGIKTPCDLVKLAGPIQRPVKKLA